MKRVNWLMAIHDELSNKPRISSLGSAFVAVVVPGVTISMCPGSSDMFSLIQASCYVWSDVMQTPV